jgi:hypothetical protein
MLFARSPRGRLLKYLGGIKFAERGRAALFRSAEHARSVGRVLKAHFKVLRPYRFIVHG